MKKLISLILALVMVMGLATTAFADEVTSPTTLTKEKNSVEIPVTGEYISELKSDEIISVDVEWDAMDFTYAATQQGTWNPSTHAYNNATEDAAWVGNTTSDIKVTNHSNVDVTASFSFAAEAGHSTVTGSFKTSAEDDTAADSKSIALDAGIENKHDEADNETVTFEIGGTLAQGTAEGTQIGTITVSVEKTTTTATEEGE